MANDVDKIIPKCEPQEEETLGSPDAVTEQRFGALEPKRREKLKIFGTTINDIELAIFYLFYAACCMFGYYHLVKGMSNWFKQPPKPSVYWLGQAFMHMNIITGLTGAARHAFGSQYVHYFVIMSYLTFLTMSIGFPMIACDFHRTMTKRAKIAFFHLVLALPATIAWIRGQQLRGYNIVKWTTWVSLMSIAFLCLQDSEFNKRSDHFDRDDILSVFYRTKGDVNVLKKVRRCGGIGGN
jgi:hypothetical protein